ncbi:hypothetical protein PMAYCL1PPCAC_19614, partial [Pristionchus mayeri]
NDSKTAAFRTPATLEMVLDWWKSDLENVENVQPASDSRMKAKPEFEEGLRVSALLSPQFDIDGLDRVKLLTELVTPVFNALYRLIPATSRTEALSSLRIFKDLDTRVPCLKINIASDVLHSFEKYRMDCPERESLILHLTNSIEQVVSILKRPVCQGSGARSDKLIFPCITALKNWINIAQVITKKDSMETPASSRAGSCPATKRTRREEQGEIPIIVID